MDDTILLSTTREGCLAKLTILQQFGEDSGMVINQSKTKFMVISGSNIDRSPLISGSLMVDNCEACTYIGSVFTQDGKIESALKCHLVSKQPHVMKFTSFVMKNCDFPFWVKQVVCEAALFSSVLYGCGESWPCNGAKVIEPASCADPGVFLGARTPPPPYGCLQYFFYIQTHRC